MLEVEDPQAQWTATLEHEAFRLFPYGLMVVERDGRIVSHNLVAARLIEAAGQDPATLTCCTLLGCNLADT
ncbi:MAG TPA: hypothetical protein VK781_01055, partial [Solirubrobacteraceae bacterium]|nr:hypothetical protein [Solirubrobacteraceae bacterium]